MAKNSGAKCKLCRRAKEKLYLKGDKCATAKCPVGKRPYGPGQHGPTARRRISDYGVRLLEKQKARHVYGIREKQFENYFDKAEKSKGVTGTNLLVLLEKRLDNVVYRLGFCPSRREARQLVFHGHFTVNGKKVDIPSFQVKIGSEISVREKSKARIKKALEVNTDKTPPEWLELNGEKLSGKIMKLPQREDIDTLVEEQLIVEYYSR